MMNLRVMLFCVAVLSFAISVSGPSFAAGTPSTSEKQLYDEAANGHKLIADALVTAKKENKKVLLQFGANWCIWCHRMHKLFETNPAVRDVIKANYIVVLLDVNKGHNADLQEKHQAKGLGVPCLVVLDSQGKRLTTKNTSELEAGKEYDVPKVIEFLKEWGRK